MKLAALRHRLGRLLRSFGSRPTREEPDADLPAVTPMVYRLAIVAVGDGDLAALLAADTLAHVGQRHTLDAPSVEVAAVRELKNLLPKGWLSWPGAAGPAEWLRLGLRREQADRVLSVLGERDPLERIALALHLLYDVRRDDLDTWLGTRGMGEQIAMLASYVGRSLELVPTQPEREQCAAVAPDLLDVDEPQLGRRARLHIVGCDVCRQHARGMRETFDILREALLAFFRTPLPSRFPTLLRQCEHQLRYPRVAWRPVVGFAVAVVLLLFAQRAARGEPAAFIRVPAAPADAVELIDRALYRFDARRPAGEVWHETIRFANQGQMLLLERWFEFSQLARTRVTVRPDQDGAPLLDVVSNARSVTYSARQRGDAPRSVELRDADLAAIVPLLRQLPFTGSLGDQVVDQRTLDVTLLAQARASSPRLLGSIMHNGRPAWMVAAESEAAGKMTLTIDRDTSSLVEVRIGDGGPGTRTRLVWDTQLLEVINNNNLPAHVFDPAGAAGTVATLNPRQLASRPTIPMGVDNARALELLPLPDEVPDEVLFSYVRPQGRGGNSLVAVYESRWSTLQIVYPMSARRSLPPSSAPAWLPEPIGLGERFEGGTYTVIKNDLPGLTLVEFALHSAPETRLGLFYWHAFADEAAREAVVRRTLDLLAQASPGALQRSDWSSAVQTTPILLTVRVDHATVLR